MPSTPTSLAPRLRLEYVRPSHAEAIQRIVGHEKLAEFTRLPHPYPGDGAITFVRESMDGRRSGREYVFAILEHGVLRGVCGLQAVDPAARTGDLGYWVDPARWGRGIATESARAVCLFAFQKLGLATVTASHAGRNTASARVLIKIGFRQTCTEKDERLGKILRYKVRTENLLSAQEAVEMPAR